MGPLGASSLVSPSSRSLRSSFMATQTQRRSSLLPGSPHSPHSPSAQKMDGFLSFVARLPVLPADIRGDPSFLSGTTVVLGEMGCSTRFRSQRRDIGPIGCRLAVFQEHQDAVWSLFNNEKAHDACRHLLFSCSASGTILANDLERGMAWWRLALQIPRFGILYPTRILQSV